MHKISTSVIKKDHAAKMGGSAYYVGDYPSKGVLHSSFIRSPHAHARIRKVHYPALPPGYFSVDYRDITGENSVHVVLDDLPVFAQEEVFYIGDAIGMIVGPDAETTAELAAACEVSYEELPAILDINDAETAFFDYHYGRGDTERAFSEADHVFEEDFETGYQEQAYLEPQGMIAQVENDVLTVRGSLQCPYYVHRATAKATGLPTERIRIVQEVTGGGFGGKEAYPSLLAAQLGVAALKAKGQAVRCIFGRREDMEFTSKRHPSRCHYRVAVKEGRVTAMEIDVRFNSGAFTTLSPVVLQRGIIASPGVYNVENLQVRGRALRTHTVPNGAYRGFGAPQTFFAVELMMDHIAASLGQDPLEFKRANLAKQGDATSTSGRYHFPVPLPEMIERVLAASDYANKRAAYAAPQDSLYRKGIGLSLWFHGAGFTGAGERDLIKAVVALEKNAAGQVEILTANTDMGQGVKTTFSKIVAHELGIPYEDIIIHNPDTSRVPDSGPTAASRSLMVVGELLRRAAIRLKEEWCEGQPQRIEEHYTHPDYLVPFNLETFSGDAYPTFAWGVGVVELGFDTLTGANEVLGSWSCFDIGTLADEAIAVGQMEGGVLQGLGYSSMEQMAIDGRGRIRNNSYSDYLIPTSVDVPQLEVQMHVCEYPGGPYGAKGAGELPLVGIPAAFIAAAEQALGVRGINHIPLTAEETLDYLSGSQHGKDKESVR
ncbi:MAG: xanthine dehydrogenase family protein molybdopterin-binding subunit [Coriobacteriales bacterium]|jgi:CO/xanthine dehydrogenase Mo-binding subunit|nr:xanthine dehydrogenase family protein molybdopterin-binding subunit [Coriobacteriales bacterium]